MSNIVTLSEAEASSTYFPGMKVWWKSQLAGGTHQELNWAKFDPGSIYPLHSHPYEQTSVVIQGRLRLTVGEETRDIGPGDMWFVPPNVPHGGEALGDEAVIFIDVYSPPSGGTDGQVTYY
ncbi:MAG: cupin domain-containing protein [Pseudomonadota bacterium]